MFNKKIGPFLHLDHTKEDNFIKNVKVTRRIK